MPISRNQVRQLCTADEYEMYTASLRVKLPELKLDQLRACIKRTRALMGDGTKGQASLGTLRKADLLSGALSRFEGRLDLLAMERRQGRR